MTDRVDAPMHGVQSTALDPMLNCPAAEPATDELRPRDDSVLPLRKRGDYSVHAAQPTFAPYDGVKCGRVWHEADAGG